MDRSIPVFNRVVVQRIVERNKERHQRALSAIRSRRTHAASLRLNFNPKGLQLQEQRRTTIEKENVILFNKMQKIFCKKLALPKYLPLPNSRRLRRLQQIHSENQGMVQRIQRQKSTISNKKLGDERRKQQDILKSICKYPYRPIPESDRCNSVHMRSRPLDSRETAQRNTNSRRSAPQIFKQVILISGQKFDVQFRRNGEGLSIDITPLEGLDSYQLFLTAAEADELIQEAGGRLIDLVRCLEKVDGKVELVLPKAHEPSDDENEEELIAPPKQPSKREEGRKDGRIKWEEEVEEQLQ